MACSIAGLRVYCRAPDSWHYQVCRSGTQRRWVGAEHDDGCPADDHVDHAVRNVRYSAIERLSPGPGTGPDVGTYTEAGRRAARLANASMRRLGVNARISVSAPLHVEQRRAPRGLPGGALHGRGAAHAEHPARDGPRSAISPPTPRTSSSSWTRHWCPGSPRSCRMRRRSST